MKKINCKGFMLAETLIVSSFIAVILIYLFVQIRNVNTNYSKTLRYNGVNELYILGEVKNYIKTMDIKSLSSSLNTRKGYYVLSDCNSEFFTNVDYCQNLFEKTNIVKAVYMDSNNIITSTDFSEGLNRFLETIKAKEEMYIIAAEFNDGSYASINVIAL